MPTSPVDAGATERGLRITGLVAGYGSTAIVHGVDLFAQEGEAVAIVGPNGAGKSTLLKAVAGAIGTMDGKVTLDGVDVTNLRGDRLAKIGVGYVPQVKDVFSPLTVNDNLELGGYGLPKRDVAKRIGEIFALFPTLGPFRKRTAGTLSGGERKLLALGRALMTRPKVLLLDEPTANLSPDLARIVLTEHVRRLTKEGVGILLVEQRAIEGLRVCDRGYVMVGGLIKVSGQASDLLANEDIGALFLGRAH